MKITYVDIIKAVTELLETTFQYPVHSDEVLEGFSMPCFFIKLVPVTVIVHENVTRTNISIVLTYFTDARDEMDWLNVQDTVRQMVQTGFYVANKARYVHVVDFSDNRIGEDADILQIIITAWYYNPTQLMTAKNEAAQDDTRRADTVELTVENETKEEKPEGLEAFHEQRR